MLTTRWYDLLSGYSKLQWELKVFTCCVPNRAFDCYLLWLHHVQMSYIYTIYLYCKYVYYYTLTQNCFSCFKITAEANVFYWKRTYFGVLVKTHSVTCIRKIQTNNIFCTFFSSNLKYKTSDSGIHLQPYI